MAPPRDLAMVHPFTYRNAEDLPDLLTRPEVAAYTGLSMPTLARWAGAGEGPRVTRFSNKVRYRKADLLAWIDEQAQVSA